MDLIVYFPETHFHNNKKTKVELDLSNYATKSDLKGVTGIDTLKFAKTVSLASLKSDVEKLDYELLLNYFCIFK